MTLGTCYSVWMTVRYAYQTKLLLFCVDDCPVCIPDQVGLITRDHMKFAVCIV